MSQCIDPASPCRFAGLMMFQSRAFPRKLASLRSLTRTLQSMGCIWLQKRTIDEMKGKMEQHIFRPFSSSSSSSSFLDLDSWDFR